MTNRGWHIPGETELIPPAHFGQEWETFNPEYDYNVDDLMEYTYQMEGHSVYTIQLFMLIRDGVFDWKRPELDWSSAAYDAEQYERVCTYFIERFKFREISTLPILEWFNILHRKLVYELMPKYKPLYERVAEGINPLAGENEYYKNRTIDSDYPQTLLSENADYISRGKDTEYQRIKEKDFTESVVNYADNYKSVDELLLDDLESMFISMYTSFVNGL